MSHSWSSAPHWKCGIPARVSRVRIPSSPPGIKNAPYGVFFISVGVEVWTKHSQSVIAGFGASVDENEPHGEVWILRSERGPLRQCGANGNQTIPSSPPEIIKTPTKSVGALFFSRIPATFPPRSFQYVQRCKFVDFYDGYATVDIYKQVQGQKPMSR